MYDKQMVGDRIRKHRTDRGLTQEQLAERTGISLRFYSDIERGSVGMSVKTMLAICSLFEITPDDLLLLDPPSATSQHVYRIIEVLNQCTPTEQVKAIELLELFLKPV